MPPDDRTRCLKKALPRKAEADIHEYGTDWEPLGEDDPRSRLRDPAFFELRVAVDARFQFFGMFWFVPAAGMGVVSADIGRFGRVELQAGGGSVFEVLFGGGAALPLREDGDDGTGLLTIHLPLLLSIGYFNGSDECGDGDTERLEWLGLAIQGGLQFTWWAWEHVGIDFQLGGGYVIKMAEFGGIPHGSRCDSRSGFPELFIRLGVSFRS
jgi:hypothetical protein